MQTETTTTNGIVVSTGLTAGGINLGNHAEGIVASTDLSAGWKLANHAEGIVVSTGLMAGSIIMPG